MAVGLHLGMSCEGAVECVSTGHQSIHAILQVHSRLPLKGSEAAMPDFAQTGAVTTIHHLRTTELDHLERELRVATEQYKIGLVLPITASDMRAEPFHHIVEQLADVAFIDTIVVVLNRAPEKDDYCECARLVSKMGTKAQILWTDGPRGSKLLEELLDAELNVAVPGKGRAVWMAFGYLLADSSLKAFALHDCDIVDYDREMLARLCLPMAHPGLDFDYCKAYYARCTDRMHGRVARLLVTPLLGALQAVVGDDRYLRYMASFRYPLSGEFAISATLARSNRVPSDWGLEVGTLAEVFRNTSMKRICQVDLGRLYEHKHQSLSLGDPGKGLMKMATDILTNIFRTLASRGVVLNSGHFVTLRSAYLRMAQDAIRQYHADSVVNGLYFDRHNEEHAIDGFADQIMVAGETFQSDPSGGEAIPNWARVLTALPDFPQRMRVAVAEDAAEFGGVSGRRRRQFRRFTRRASNTLASPPPFNRSVRNSIQTTPLRRAGCCPRRSPALPKIGGLLQCRSGRALPDSLSRGFLHAMGTKSNHLPAGRLLPVVMVVLGAFLFSATTRANPPAEADQDITVTDPQAAESARSSFPHGYTAVDL